MPENITLNDILTAVRRQWKLEVCIIGAFFLSAVAYLHAATPIYTASMSVVGVSGGSKPVSGGISGLAGLVGVNLDGATEQIDLFREAVQSGVAAEAIAADDKLMHRLFAGEWDAAAKAWREPPSALGSVSNTMRAVLGVAPRTWSAPDARRVERLLDDAVTISFGPDSPVTEIEVDHKDPETAIMLLTALHRGADAALRAKMLARTTQYIAYLQQQFQKETIGEYRDALINAMAEQEKQRMIALAGDDYAAEIFSRPSVTAYPTKPNGPIVLIAAILAGVLVGFLAAMYREFMRS